MLACSSNVQVLIDNNAQEFVQSYQTNGNFIFLEYCVDYDNLEYLTLKKGKKYNLKAFINTSEGKKVILHKCSCTCVEINDIICPSSTYIRKECIFEKDT